MSLLPDDASTKDEPTPMARGSGIGAELKAHAPFTLLGALSGVALMAALVLLPFDHSLLQPVFGGLHAVHVVLSAIVTTGLYWGYRRKLVPAILIGLFGSIGIATLSDIVFPHHGAALVLRATGGSGGELHLHLAVIELWYLIVPAALLGVAIGILLPRTKVSHAGHVLLSTWASLFYILAHSSPEVVWLPRLPLIVIVLFVAVWVPCCISDIVFPMLFVRGKAGRERHHH